MCIGDQIHTHSLSLSLSLTHQSLNTVTVQVTALVPHLLDTTRSATAPATVAKRDTALIAVLVTMPT